jgi:hypothetical protein
MTAREQLLLEIESFLAQTGMTATRFSEDATGERGFLIRLRKGSDVTLGTADRVRKFMREWRPPANPKKRPAYQAAI